MTGANDPSNKLMANRAVAVASLSALGSPRVGVSGGDWCCKSTAPLLVSVALPVAPVHTSMLGRPSVLLTGTAGALSTGSVMVAVAIASPVGTNNCCVSHLVSIIVVAGTVLHTGA